MLKGRQNRGTTFIPAVCKTADSLSLNAVSTGILSAFASGIRLRDTFLPLSFALFHHTGLA
jgi:hypothetical protein